jgi:hypothetical protein
MDSTKFPGVLRSAHFNLNGSSKSHAVYRRRHNVKVKPLEWQEAGYGLIEDPLNGSGTSEASGILVLDGN